MVNLTIRLLIFLLLLYGCYTDLKWRHVSNKISLSIAALAIILINWQILAIKFTFILFLIFSWSMQLIGAADVKVLIPITLMFNPWQFFIFLFIFCISGSIIGLIIQNKFNIPGYIPITTALLFSIF
jgi:prepilin peptidase CpaA